MLPENTTEKHLMLSIARPSSHDLSFLHSLCDLFNDSLVKEAKVAREEREERPPQSRRPLNRVLPRLAFSSQWAVFTVS
eukprot:CCRYP_008604-RB/>CCRYP_008604-RB protein AED:0.43 eAED:0.43 QI:327/1/1/1/0.5/0.66/3/661/78